MQNPLKRFVWADIIRIVAIAMVIEMHSGDRILYMWGKAPFKNGAISSWWASGVIYESLASICVPLLFMLSGYLLLSSNVAIHTFFKKRFPKILIPLIFWAALYMWWDGVFTESTSVLAAVKLYIRSVLNGPVHYHLWFLYSLLGLYLVTPIIRKFVQPASDTELIYFLVLWLFATIVLPLFQKLTGLGVTLFIQPYVSGYLGYFVAGYYLGKQNYSIRQVWIAVALVIFLVTGKTLWAYYLTFDGGRFDTNLFEYLTWHLIATSLAGFIALKGIAQFLEKRISPGLEKIIAMVSGTTFGIYLIHDRVLGLMDSGTLGIRLYSDSFHPLFAIPLTVLVGFMLSFLLIFLIQKIPVVNKMLAP